MTHYLIHRPIAVCIVTLALAVLGVLAFNQLPVSLLPDIPIPEITVQVNHPTASARELQRTIEQPLRNQLLQVAHLNDIESVTQNGLAILTLRFDYGTNIRLAYLETNEKIDAILGQLPRDLERPKVIKAGAGDIPVFNLNVVPGPTYREDFLALSEFCENVLKRRIEQLPDVALVDVTGLAQPEAVVQVDPAKLASLGLTEQNLVDVLKQANLQPGNFNIREGPYQYSIRFSSVLQTPQDVEKLYFSIGGSAGSPAGTAQSDPRVTYFADNVLTAQETHVQAPRRLIALREVATVTLRERPLTGSYGFIGNNLTTRQSSVQLPAPGRSICLAIIKQRNAQLLHLRTELAKLQKQFKADYPQIECTISQDQTELLDLSISNLVSNLLTGALLTFVMIFFFMRDRRLPLLIGLVIPISIAVTFLGFYLLGLSINIVSLAGLVLGMGEIVDSAIIILENIEEKREAGLSVEVSCVSGAEEVIRPLFTSVLTNSAVFLPLLLLSGLAGALFFDQAVSVSLALGVSLACSYTLVPVLYYVLYRNEGSMKAIQPPTRFMVWLGRMYHLVFSAAFRFKWALIISLFMLLGGAYLITLRIEKQGMPDVTRTELEIVLDWNEPLTVAENKHRTEQLIRQLQPAPIYTSLFIGQQQFLLNRQLQQAENESLVSLRTTSSSDYSMLSTTLTERLKKQFPKAIFTIRPARNVFEQLFNTTEPALRLKLYNAESQQPINWDVVDRITRNLAQFAPNEVSNSVGQQNQLVVRLQIDKLLLYDVDETTVIQRLKTIFNNNQVTTLQTAQRFIPLVLSATSSQETSAGWRQAFVYNRQKQPIPIRNLIDVRPQTDYKAFYADKEGTYIPVDFAVRSSDIPILEQQVSHQLQAEKGIVAGLSGRYFRDQTYLGELLIIAAIAVLLLFCILTAQFESLQQPLIVLLIIFLGLSGAVWGLYLAGESLNVLSAIGMVVLVGLLDNDSILKIDTMNRSRETMSLIDAIRSAGQRRLKSQMMTFLTTVLGLLPVLFSGGLGSELQQPLAISIIGGMCIGILVSWTVIPILYWWLASRKRSRQSLGLQ
ncbi:efflux RND transporter permease subunit [Spirosoma sp. BT702]|uniref:Efflux RND transporter permease subunit n=1 Tax=Spirosoma profusum TaxID=2771354 RepID=A0A927G9V1_9BACT|nr:efflux RND transporter permease subunit [Spirosoma profusum]MBD2705006.1 efflux RND transporter permease subunit [Spirosoma profusum]